MSDIEEIRKELKEVKNNIEKKIDKIYWRIAIGCGIGSMLGVLLFFLLSSRFVCCRTFDWPDVVVFVSLVIGFVAIVITAFVTLTRRNPEE